jgi:transposase
VPPAAQRQLRELQGTRRQETVPRPERIDPTHDWQQLELRFRSPGQRTYELIRPVVLFGHSPAERAAETGAAERTLYRQVARFEQLGMASFVPPPKVEKHRALLTAVRQAILDARREHPPLNLNELRTICWVRFGQRPSTATVRHLLAEESPPPRTHRRFPPFHAIADPAERRLAIVRLHVEGWNAKSIAQYLETSRQTVHMTLKRWIAEGVAGLDDKSHAPKQPATKVTLRAIATVKELQENPLLGEWRTHAALKRLGIHLSPRTCGRILARNRALYGLPRPAPAAHAPKPMPFAAQRRHQYWTADIRYLDHGLGDFKVYSITILDNYSRAILASGLSRTQDLSAFLLILYMAVAQHGAPEVLVSDSGGVFLAKQAQRIYAALGVRKEEIDRRQPWQSYIETAFGVQRRMADWAFAQAGTWPELLAVHDQWVADYNYQDHFAHRQRPEERRSPAAVLHTVRGRLFAPEDLHRIFYTTRSGRVLDRAGYVRFRRWRVYAERGLPGEQAAVWLYAEHLTVVYRDEPLAQYRVAYQPDRRHLKMVAKEHLFETPHRSPQLPLWVWRDEEWLPALRLPAYAARSPRPPLPHQPALFALENIG